MVYYTEFGPQFCTISMIWQFNRNANYLSPTLDSVIRNYIKKNFQMICRYIKFKKHHFRKSLWHAIDLLPNPRWSSPCHLMSCYLVLKMKLNIVLIILVHLDQGPSEISLVFLFVIFSLRKRDTLSSALVCSGKLLIKLT